MGSDAAVLGEVGVVPGQGWFFARPGSADELLDGYPLAEQLVAEVH